MFLLRSISVDSYGCGVVVRGYGIATHQCVSTKWLKLIMKGWQKSSFPSERSQDAFFSARGECHSVSIGMKMIIPIVFNINFLYQLNALNLVMPLDALIYFI